MNWRDRIVVDPAILDEYPSLQAEDSDVLEDAVVIKRFLGIFVTNKRLQELAVR